MAHPEPEGEPQARQAQPLDARLDTERLKAAFSRIPAGVVVITSATSAGDPVGATVSSFSSLSLAPPLVCFSLLNSSKTLSAILGHRHFAVHVVAEPHRHLAMHFAGGVADKFETVAYEASPHGVPLLSAFETRLQCVVARALPAGDHQLVVGRILDVALAEPASAPVAWFQRGFRLCEPLPH